MRSLLALVLIGLVETASGQQEQCFNIPNPGTESATGFARHATQACTVNDGTYVVYGQSYRLDMNIAANGSCTVRAYDPPSQSCVVKEVQQRGVRSAKIVPTGGVGWNMYPATGYPQTFDTRVDPVKNPPGYATWVPLTLERVN